MFTKFDTTVLALKSKFPETPSRQFPNCAPRDISKYCFFFKFMCIVLSNGY